MRKNHRLPASVIFFIAFIMLITSSFFAGCSGSNDGDDGFFTPSPTPTTGKPRLLFVSTRNEPQSTATDMFEGDLDFTAGVLKNIRQVTPPLESALWNDPYMCKTCNRVFAAMTQGSMLYYNIRSVDYSTGEMITLTDSDERNNVYPVVTDGGKIAYISNVRESEGYEIRLMNTDGTDNKILTTTDKTASELAKIPRENRLLVTLSDADRNTDIYIYDITKNLWTQLTNTPDIHEYAPNVNSAGKIIYLRDGDVEGKINIYEMDIDGSNNRKITDNEMDYNGPVWQYDRYIVFQSGNDIWFYDTDTRKNVNLTNSEGMNYSHSVFTE